MSIAENLARLESEIASVCTRTDRRRAEVTLVAVAKTRTAAEVDEAIRAGVRDIGENRVQEALAKKPLVRERARWHLVGNLQTNKVKKALDVFDVFEGVDSLHLAQEIQRRSAEAGRRVSVLIEVNTSAEPTKHGVAPSQVPSLIEQVLKLDRLELAGLMTIGPGWAVEDAEASRPCFRQLRGIADDARARFAISLPHLSMGMSSDFVVGIEEGATIIRVGTAIFGPRPA